VAALLTQDTKITILVVAGETSGDMHTAKVIEQLNAMGRFSFFGIGGDAMAAQGVDLLFHVHDMAFMGFLEVVKHLPFIKKVFKTLEKAIDERKPDLVLLTDYPGFNLKLAKLAKKRSLPVIYFISPQLWAWGKHRISQIAAYVDKMLVILPFEKQFYRDRNINAEFVGHPLKDETPVSGSREQFLAGMNLDPEKPCLALLPGSRKQEVQKLLEPMYSGFRLVKQNHPDIQGIIAAAPHVPGEFYAQYTDPSLRMAANQTRSILSFCDAAVVASGTATLECAIAELPMVIIYKLSPVSYEIGKKIVRLDAIGLVNIVAGKKIVPELIQHDANPAAIARETSSLLFNSSKREQMISDLRSVNSALGSAGASKRAAREILSCLQNRTSRDLS